MKKILPHILFSVLYFVYALTLPAQNLGIATPGSTTYPQTTIGNVLTENSSNAGNFLIFNSITITAPLTATSIRTFGSANGTITVTIYNKNGSNSPGTKLFTEVAASVTAGTLSSITIPVTFLPAGTYWLAYNMNSSSSTANFITKSTGVTGFVRKSMALTYGTSFPNNPGVTNLASGNQDHIAVSGVTIQGYAKATKATLATNTAFSSVNFYTHAAGNARLAIYSDNGSGTAPSARLWESGDIPISGSGQPKVTTVNISSGTPSILSLAAGTYWLAWQWNIITLGPSYTAGAANTGSFIVQSYGAFPASWSGGTASADNWTIYAAFCTPPTTSAAQTNISCFSSSDGSITVTGSGGVSPYTFSIDNGANYLAPTGTNLRVFTGLAPNTAYRVRVKDNIGCESKLIQ
jgi:hypothetical protein